MVRLAAFQGIPASNFDERAFQIIDLLQQADERQFDFLCFPEGFLTGYYAEKELAEETSIEVESPLFQKFLKDTSSFRTTFVIGFNERSGDKIFDSAAAIEKGRLLGVQRKHYLYHPYFTSDNRFIPFESKGITFGVVICLDTNYFEPSRLLALQEASILFVPICNKVSLDHPFTNRPPYYSQFVARTHENKCWLVGADWIWPNDEKLCCPGHSVIYDPDGREVMRSCEGKSGFIFTDVSQEQLFHKKGRRVTGSKDLKEKLIQLTEAANTIGAFK